MPKNFYEKLEVPETASSDEIKKAYRRLSLKYHPDKNRDKPETVEMFQKISEAYEVLGDASKKQEYDMSRKNPFQRMQMHGQDFENINIDELFSNLFFGGQQNPFFGQGMHNDMGMNSFGGGVPNIRIFRNGMPVNMGPEKPAPIIKTVLINMSQVLNGAKIPVEVERWIMENNNKIFETVTLYVDIFKGIDQNEVILLQNEGNAAHPTCKGDVKIFVKIENNSSFIRNGLDLILEHTISLKEALCGFMYELKHLNGRVYTINNKSGNIITPEYKKVIPNMGLTRENHVGNLILHFHVNFPTALTPEQIIKLSEILI
uniref:J domain-containing protein n=1 Tax=viral metagenome TaxID=1070528 RepID=A0A6C0BB15_9ZZZZ